MCVPKQFSTVIENLKKKPLKKVHFSSLALLKCGDLPPMALKPLVTRSQALEAIPGVSEWVLEMIKQGYLLQFAYRPGAMVQNSVQSNEAHILCSEVETVLTKGAKEIVLCEMFLTTANCMDAALSPLRWIGVHILKYLDNWLVLAQSKDKLCSYRSLLFSDLERLGLRISLAKFVVPKPMNFIPRCSF